MKDKKYLVYQIYNKVEKKSYIGCTCHFDNRIKEHKKGKYEWQIDFAEHPENFEIHILEYNIEEDKIGLYEKQYIDLYNSINNGYNKRRQGNGITSEIRQKMSETHKGKPTWNKGLTGICSEETLQKMSEAMKGENHPMYGKHHTEETIKKISESNKGKRRSEETKKKLSDAHKGKTPWNKGKHYTEETLQKMSEAMKGKFVGENHPMYGKHHTEESRRKMADARKKYWENKKKCQVS